MRGAHRQQRSCYLYAFSGPNDVKELELKVDTGSLLELLNFLRFSFGGGTDVDRPLELSLDRLEQRDWSQVLLFTVLEHLVVTSRPQVGACMVGRGEMDNSIIWTCHFVVAQGVTMNMTSRCLPKP